MRKQKGITLIALVITIIVLLILAGVSISMISGDDGIATKASQAAEKTKEKSDEEMEKLGTVDDYITEKVNQNGTTETIPEEREPGLYNGNTFTAWADLVSAGTVNLNGGVLTTNHYVGDYSIEGNSSKDILVGDLVLPETGITSIGENGFAYCSNLTSVDIPNTVVTIEDNAFAACKFTSVVIPESVTNLAYYSFRHCEELVRVDIENSEINIEDYAFEYCSSLADVYFVGTEAQWTAIDVYLGHMADEIHEIVPTIHYNS